MEVKKIKAEAQLLENTINKAIDDFQKKHGVFLELNRKIIDAKYKHKITVTL